MSNFINYFRVQFLRGLKLYPVIISLTLVVTLGLTFLVGNLFSANSAEEGNRRIQIGLVGDISDSHLGIGVFALQNFDTSKYYVDFLELDEETAAAKLDKNEIMGYVVIPDGFLDSVLRGENKKLTYIAGNSPAVLGPMLIEEIAQIISDVIVESQNGIYGLLDFADDMDVSWYEYSELSRELNLEYIDLVLEREQFYDLQPLGVGNGLSFEDYYVCAIFILLLMLCGVICVNLLVHSDYSLPRSLYARGYSSGTQVLAEYLPFFMMLILNTLLVFCALGAFAPGIGLLPQFSSFSEFFMLGLMVLPAVALICAMQFLLYELTSNVISAVLLQILSTVALSFASGFLLPLSSLPESLQTLSAFLPTGIAARYVSALFVGEGAALPLLASLGVTALALTLAALVRKFKIRSSRI